MKKLVLLLFLSTGVSTISLAQNCGNVDEKKDAFTGKAVKSARIPVGNLTTKWLVTMNQSDGATYMKWEIAAQGEFNQQLPMGTIFMMKLEDGTILNLKTMEGTTPVTQAVGGNGVVNIFTTFNLRFNLSKEELQSMAKSPIEDIKIDVPGLTIKNPKLKGKQMDKIKDASGCLLSTFG